MISLTNFFNTFLFKIITGFFSLLFAIPSLPSGLWKTLPTASEDFTPVVRFVVCSDVHLEGEGSDNNNEEHFRKLFDAAYSYSESQSYSALDAIIVNGDFTGRGRDDQYELFNSIVNEKIKGSTQLICTLGNHEFIDYRDYDPTITYTKYKQYICEDVDRHVVINGYHFVCVSYSDDAYTFTDKTDWLSTEIESAIADTPDKPVFVFNHPHPFGTVYGSVNWGDLDLRTTLSKYSQVIDFSGHSHYAANDPRSIWQESFTAVGSGCVAAQMSCLDYLTGGDDVEGESGAFWIVEADKDGNVRLKLYDVVCDCFFDEADYYLENTSNLTGRRYTWNNLKSLDTKPEFPDDAKITASKDENGNVILSYPDAAGYYPAESYKINVYNGLKSVVSGTYDSNYARAVRNGMNTNLGQIESGTYTVSITPYSPYAKAGKAITGEITIS